jgi:hypothetical protein
MTCVRACQRSAVMTGMRACQRSEVMTCVRACQRSEVMTCVRACQRSEVMTCVRACQRSAGAAGPGPLDSPGPAGPEGPRRPWSQRHYRGGACRGARPCWSTPLLEHTPCVCACRAPSGVCSSSDSSHPHEARHSPYSSSVYGYTLPLADSSSVYGCTLPLARLFLWIWLNRPI